MKIGDTVRIKETCNAKFAQGLEGKVRFVASNAVYVELGDRLYVFTPDTLDEIQSQPRELTDAELRSLVDEGDVSSGAREHLLAALQAETPRMRKPVPFPPEGRSDRIYSVNQR